MACSTTAESRFSRGAIESGCRTLSGLELEIGAWSFLRTGAQHFKFSSGREVAREPGCGGAGGPEPAREGRVRGAVRGLTTWAGNAAGLEKPAPQEEVRDRSRTHFHRLD